MDPVHDPRLDTQAGAALDRLRSALDAAGEEPATVAALVERLGARSPSAAAGAGPIGNEVAALLAAEELSATQDRLAAAGRGVDQLLHAAAEAQRSGGNHRAS